VDRQAFESGQREVLERIASGAPLPDLLDRVIELVERQAQGMLCSILLVDADRGVVRHGAARSLPPEFVRAIDGLAIGPHAGSCGTAAYRRERVIVEDIATHEYWADYRALALPFGLRACWSSPIFSSTQSLLGTFAMYYHEPRGPSDVERYWVDRATHLASIAIERDQAEEAIRFSEVRFRQIVDTAYEGVWLVDTHARTQFVNERMCEMFGYAREEMIGRVAFDFVHESDRPRAERNFRLHPEKRELFEYRFRRKDGSDLWATLAASPLRDREGKVVSLMGMVSDVGHLKRAEAAERLQALTYNAVSDILYYVGVEPSGDFRFLSVNPAFLATTGLTEDQVVGRLVRDVIPAPSRELVLGHYARAVREKRPVSWVEATQYPAGLKHGEVSITPIVDEAGQCSSLVGAIHDITEHVSDQQKIRQQAELLDHANDAILLRDADGTVRFWNQGAERMYGWTSAEALGRKVTDLIYKDPMSFHHAQSVAIETGQWKGQLEQVTKTGQSLTVEASWTVLRDEAGALKSVLAINSDITDKKRLEQQVMRAQRLESLGTLAGGIAHDFNNILSAVVANVAIALEDLDARHPAREALAEIEKASLRATDLVKQILTFSRQQKPKRQFVRLVDIVVEAMKLLKATTPAAIRIQTRFDARTPQVFADPSQLHQVIVNLATNAGHAMSEEGGVLTIAVERSVLETPLLEGPMELAPGEYATLVVTDTGTGMDAVTLERIYDPFFTTKEAGKGTGLGLAVVHGIVRAHDGAIAVRTAVGRGTTFRIHLPAAKVHDVGEGPVRPPETRGTGDRVLYVDDEEAIVKATITVLGRLGYHVTGAVDPLQALESFQSDPSRYDVVVVDFSMPGVSGLDFARAVLRVRPGLPIIVTSGSLPPEDVAKLTEAGVAAVVHKPSTPQELSTALKRVLAPRST
jgi:PAS domain S-box-containing protein